nr:11192_t:CDS:2 [Entrophospora candida]
MKERFHRIEYPRDIHLDPFYLPLSDPTQYCHRYSDDVDKNRAGIFGTLRSECDSPYSLINSTFEHFKKYIQDDIDFIIYTGDSLRHDQHNQLPGGPNTFFQNLTDIWAPLNLNLTEEYFINGGGYFRQDINSKLTVLNLNSMYLYESNDEIEDCDVIDSPGYKQLKWMEMELIDAKSRGINVYISQHITPLDSSGHTNQDSLTLVTESDNAQNPYNLVFLGHEQPSAITDRIILVLNNAPINNPAFRVYSYSQSSNSFGALLDYTQYYNNLNKSAENHKIEWEIEYVAREVYNITKLGTEDWVKVLSEFQKPNSILWGKYLKYINVGINRKKKKSTKLIGQ